MMGLLIISTRTDRSLRVLSILITENIFVHTKYLEQTANNLCAFFLPSVKYSVQLLDTQYLCSFLALNR
jgi:hypothetical protein